MLRKFTIYNLQFTIKLLLFFLSFYILHSTFYITPAFAQTPSTSSGQASQLPTSISPTSPLYTDMLVHNMFHTFSCLAVGSSIIGQPCLTYQVTKNAQGAIQSIPVLSQVNLSGGTLGATTSLIGALYTNPPVRTADYLASVGTGLGIVKEANAQVVGSGAQVLSPILTLWQVSRNIAYLIMIIIFVIIGLMVMFRNRINPQTVITAQAALPGLVIGLILITFSYFLAGLIADTAFVGTNLVGAYFSAVKGQADNPQDLVKEISPESVLSIFSGFVSTVGPGTLGSGVDAAMGAIDRAGGLAATIVHGAIEFVAYQFGSQVGPILAVPVGTPICAIASTASFGAALAPCVALTNLIGQTAGGAAAFAYALANPNGAVSLGITILMIFILLYAMLRLALRLINNYLSIILLVITAPFQLLFASLPGRQGLATNWILNLLANVLAFPAVIAAFYFVAFLLRQDFGPLKVSQINQIQNSGFPFSLYAAEKINVVDNATFPLLGGINLDFIRLLLAFGVLMATPAIPDIINRSIGRLGQAGQLIGQEVTGAYGAGQRYAGQAGQAPGKIGQDISQFGQIPSQTFYEYDTAGNIIGIRRQTGLWGRVRPPRLPGMGGGGGAPPPIKP